MLEEGPRSQLPGVSTRGQHISLSARGQHRTLTARGQHIPLSTGLWHQFMSNMKGGPCSQLREACSRGQHSLSVCLDEVDEVVGGAVVRGGLLWASELSLDHLG